LESRRVAGDADDFGAFLTEQLDRLEADATRRTGENDAATLQTTHGPA
jgi:hypothetical protein